ncbi:tripartite tricarboxylate transporter substrate-binding protein [Pseudonocardia adelaidensis]|uniref:Tripartite tricarboxylate transporter substrate binding protein n=1 Tax=Pseudonocardia adelaidensis TaxID=648754 RepID=A0ABP9NSD4_9PSEU
MATRPLRAAVAGVLCALLAACGTGGGGGQKAGPFAGEDVDLVVPYEPGGGYDAYARALAPYLEDCLDATVVVRNEPGAGGLVATNQTFTAGTDEKRIQIVNTVGLVSAQIAQAEGVGFDLEKVNWIGRIAAPPNVVVVATGSPVQGLPDLVHAGRPVRFVSTGPGSNDYIAPNILGAALGFPLEIVTGFAGAPEARAAVVAGNADAHILPVDSQLSAIESGDVRPIVTLDEERDPFVPDTPTVFEAAAPDAHAKAMIDSLVALGQTGRALMASPQMPADRVEALRAAFGCAIGNPDLVADLEKQERPLDPLGGPETAQLVRDVLTAPEEFRQLIVASY